MEVAWDLQFMHVFQVRESLSRLDNGIMDIEITVFHLSSLDHLHQVLDGCVNFVVLLVRQEIACSLYPLGDVRIPE